jgi:ribosomal protein S18 acetylase RimI-like enzyme
MAQVRLRPLTAEEFPAWRDAQVAGYAGDLASSGRVSAERARGRAEESFARLLPDGLGTSGQVVWVGEDAASGHVIGCLWLGPGEDPGTAWVNTIEVDPAFRGRGYGRALMLAFEDEARSRGFTSVGLNVFGDNAVARGLYESLGYREVARQMTKPLSGEGRGPSGGGR